MSAAALFWTSRILTGAIALFLLVASVAPKLVLARVATDSFASLGWPLRYVQWIGGLELACVVLFVVPRTQVLGAVLMTGLLGGAIATHLRAESPLFSHTLFGVYLGVAMWLAVLLRDPAARAVLWR